MQRPLCSVLCLCHHPDAHIINTTRAPALQELRQTCKWTECQVISAMISIHASIARCRDGCPNSALRGTTREASVEKWLRPINAQSSRQITLGRNLPSETSATSVKLAEIISRSSLYPRQLFKDLIYSPCSMFVGLNQQTLHPL